MNWRLMLENIQNLIFLVLVITMMQVIYYYRALRSFPFKCIVWNMSGKFANRSSYLLYQIVVYNHVRSMMVFSMVVPAATSPLNFLPTCDVLQAKVRKAWSYIQRTFVSSKKSRDRGGLYEAPPSDFCLFLMKCLGYCRTWPLGHFS